MGRRHGKTRAGGRRGLGGAVPLGLIVALAALFPTGASAGAHANERASPGQSAALTVAGSNGYTLFLKSERGMLVVLVSRGRPGAPTMSPRGRMIPASQGNVAWSSYATPTPKDPGTIEADLGPFGKVSLAFQPSGETAVTNVDLENKTEKCIGATKIIRHLGTFTGTLSFHGENGYTAVDTTSAPGSVGTSTFRNCTTIAGASARASAAASPRRHDVALQMGGKSAPSLFASTDSSRSRFLALSGEVLTPQLSVLRIASASAGGSSFRFSPALDSATLRPPGPFSGSASFHDPPNGPAYLRGDLAVKFPGLTAPLTGPGFDPPQLKLLPSPEG